MYNSYLAINLKERPDIEEIYVPRAFSGRVISTLSILGFSVSSRYFGQCYPTHVADQCQVCYVNQDPNSYEVVIQWKKDCGRSLDGLPFSKEPSNTQELVYDELKNQIPSVHIETYREAMADLAALIRIGKRTGISPSPEQHIVLLKAGAEALEKHLELIKEKTAV